MTSSMGSSGTVVTTSADMPSSAAPKYKGRSIVVLEVAVASLIAGLVL